MAPKHVYVLIPGTCLYTRFCEKEKLRMQMYLRCSYLKIGRLSWIIQVGPIKRVLKSGKEKQRKKARKRDVTIEARSE